MKLHSKHGGFLRMKTKSLETLHTERVLNGSTRAQKESVEGNFGCSPSKVLNI